MSEKQAIGTEAISISLIINFCLFLNVSGDIFFVQCSGLVFHKKPYRNQSKDSSGKFLNARLMCTKNFISMHIAKYWASGNVTQIKNVKTIFTSFFLNTVN